MQTIVRGEPLNAYAELYHEKRMGGVSRMWYKITHRVGGLGKWKGPYRDTVDAEGAACYEAKILDLDLIWVGQNLT